MGQTRDHQGRPVVAVTGIGVVTSLGTGVEQNWAAMIAGRSGIRRITRFPTDGMRVTIAGTIDHLRHEDDTTMMLTLRAGTTAAKEAIANANIGRPGDFPGPMFAALPPTEMEWPYRRELFNATNSEDQGDAYDRMMAVARRSNDRTAFHKTSATFIPVGLADALGTRGAPISVTTACASGATAIQLAVEAIRRGDTDVALSLGADCTVNNENVIRFNLLSALSVSNDVPEEASKPFSGNRDGFVFAEGAGALVLEDYDAAVARGARIHAVIRGVAEQADDFHRTRSKPDGSAIIGAIRRTIMDSGLAPEEIDYINAHGTSTPENDKMEAMSLEAVFGPALAKIPLSSNKSMIGHCITAAGAIEAVVSIKTIQTGVLPPTINYKVPDPAITVDVVPNVARQAKVGKVLSNSFGFGGQNACLVITAEPA